MTGYKQAILLAEDNPDDVLLIRLALEKTGSDDLLRIVRDGEEVLNYLQGEEVYADREQFPVPKLLLLDLGIVPGPRKPLRLEDNSRPLPRRARSSIGHRTLFFQAPDG